MTPSATAGIRLFPIDSPVLPFWAWSALLHIGVVALFSVIHLTHKVERPPTIVKVTLVEATTLNQISTLAEPTSAEPIETEPTPMPSPPLQAQRPAPLPPLKSIRTPQPPPTPTIRTTLAKISQPSTPIRTTQPMQRQVLRDHHAANNLNLKNYLKVAQRVPSSRSTTQQPQSHLDVSSASTVLPTNMSTRAPLTMASRTTPSMARSLTPHVLKAQVPGSGSISKSKVGLGRTIPPVYPRIARESGWEGTVLVRVAVQPDGSPDSIKVRKSSGHQILDEAAVEAVKKWRFSPAKDGNIPIRSVVEIPINFDLRKQG